MNTSNADSATVLALIEAELRHFATQAQRAAFQTARTAVRWRTETWDYGPETHRCAVVAADGQTEIVYCPTGFGPSFPWAVQIPDQSSLGTDGEWCAYLYEAFVTSSLWPPGPPSGFMLMGPGER